MLTCAASSCFAPTGAIEVRNRSSPSGTRSINDQATRAEVTTFVRRTNIPSIFGGTVRFSRSGDPLPTRFVLYKVTNGKYTEVG